LNIFLLCGKTTHTKANLVKTVHNSFQKASKGPIFFLRRVADIILK